LALALAACAPLALLPATPAAAAAPLERAETGKPAPAFTAQGIDGKPIRLADYRGKTVVIEWTSPVCPFTIKKYEKGAMQALQRQARASGYVWLVVNTSAKGMPGYLSPAQAKARIAKQKMTVSGFILDDGRLGRLYGAKATPQVFIVAPDGRLVFQGGVDDDAFAQDGPKAVAAVRAAMADLKAGRSVAVADVRPYGCPVEYPAQ
jgi:hypothetical protein